MPIADALEAPRPPYTPAALVDQASASPAPRSIHTADRLPPQRELAVYMSECSPGAKLGAVTVTSEQKLSDVAQTIKSQLDVDFKFQMSCGTADEPLKVPLHPKQYSHPALPFFPSESNHVLLDAA
jgi:hypothetical protein